MATQTLLASEAGLPMVSTDADGSRGKDASNGTLLARAVVGKPIVVVHLTASPFFGGPERQMLELARMLPRKYRSIFLSYSESGGCQQFIQKALDQGFEAHGLRCDTPSFWRMFQELAGHLRKMQADLLCCHNYKPSILGRIVARRLGIPVIAVSRGWTGESRRVRFYEVLDRWNLRWMDHVICVSSAQADKVLRVGVPIQRVTVIHNAIDVDRFAEADPSDRGRLEQFFADPPKLIVGAAGRLSPEKGFHDLVDAAGIVTRNAPWVGFVLFGSGPLQDSIQERIVANGLAGRFVLAGFAKDLDRFFPHFDVFVQSSYTEGMPNVLLEAQAAKVAVVATAVGGTPEIIQDRINGLLSSPGNAKQLAEAIEYLLSSDSRRREMGLYGRRMVTKKFTFQTQCKAYQHLIDQIVRIRSRRPTLRHNGNASR
jgi:glycosyltransferase involved in cell wall biosynthesis